MKVILLEDVKKVGKKGEVVEVNDGYGRNVLIGKKVAVEATNKTLNDLKLQNKNAEKIAKEEYEAALALAEKMKDMVVECTMRTGEGGRTFGSVSTKEIAAAAKKQLNLDLDKKKMQLKDPINSLGVHEVPVKLHSKVTATLRVHVTEA